MVAKNRLLDRYQASQGPLAWALVADLEGSREVADRAALARALETALREIREISGPDARAWIAPLESVRGLDELSGVLSRPGPALAAVFHLARELWPHRFRFALAWGDLDVGFDSGQAGAMDGPAFHRAADALRRARRQRLPLALQVPGWPEEAVALVEDAVRLHTALTAAWTPRQAEVVRTWWRLGPQRQVARHLGIAQSTVSETLAKARARDLRALEEDLPRHLDWLHRTFTPSAHP